MNSFCTCADGYYDTFKLLTLKRFILCFPIYYLFAFKAFGCMFKTLNFLLKLLGQNVRQWRLRVLDRKTGPDGVASRKIT